MSNESKQYTYVVKTLFGLEDVLAAELKNFGVENVQTTRRAVLCSGDESFLYKANLCLRTALSVLLPVYKTNINDQQEFYDVLRNIDWSNYLTTRKTFSIDPVSFSKIFTHTQFMAQRSKDAIVDYFRQKYGARPDVDLKNPDVKINIHLSGKSLTVSLDSSGEPLFKRGYRKYHGEAPINEVLAAGIILLSGWNCEENFMNPMCGSATLAIEAALMAKNVAPGIFRTKYGFETWTTYNKKLFRQIYEELEENTLKSEIICSDISSQAIEGAKINIDNALLSKNINIMKSDFFSTSPSKLPTTVIINPPYGERMKGNNLADFYKEIGHTLKQNYAGCNVWIISSNLSALKNIGLKTKQQIEVFNGPIKCRLHHYEIYKGSMKSMKQKG